MSQQHASVSQGWICSDHFTLCHTEIEVADQTFHLTQSQYTDTGPTSPSTDPILPGRLAGEPLECQFLSHWYDLTLEKFRCKQDWSPGSSALEADAVTTRPVIQSLNTSDIVLLFVHVIWKFCVLCSRFWFLSWGNYRLVGLVVKASASRAEGPGFESRLRQDFFGVESYQWLKNWHSSGYPARRLAL